jgi:ribosomal protein L15
MFNRLLQVRGGGRGGRRGGRGRGRGAGDKPGSGLEGFCVCPQCGHKEAHVAGQRCLDRSCPKCGTKMTRE